MPLARFPLKVKTDIPGPSAPLPSDNSSAERKGQVLQKYLLIAVGGAFGSVARYWVTSSITNRSGTRFPYGTLIVNISACFLIGFCLAVLNSRSEIHPAWRYLVPIGFIGAYSTFSTFEWETVTTIQAGGFPIALVYILTSLILGFVAVWAGIAMAKVL